MPYIGKSPQFGVRNRFVYLATSGATSVSGADANGATLTFTDGAFVDVYLNGVLLKPTTDYNTSTANTIANLSALNTNDEVTVVVYDVFSVADMVSATSGGTFSGNVTFSSDVSVGDDLSLASDSAIINFGADSDVSIIHQADNGLIIKNNNTGDGSQGGLVLQTGETNIEADDVLGRIQFQAPDEGTDTDSRLVAAEIAAVSEGDFSSSNNATKLSFKTGASEAATEKMTLSSAGLLNINVNSSNTDPDADLGAIHKFINTNTTVNTGSMIILGGNNNPGTSIYGRVVDTSTNKHQMGFSVRNASGSSTTRVIIDGPGNAYFANPDPDSLDTAIFNDSSGSVGPLMSSSNRVDVTRDSSMLALNHTAGSAGAFVDLRDRGTTIATISHNGSGVVTYNAFTGCHWGRFSDNSKPTMLKGTILETIDEMCEWYDVFFEYHSELKYEDGDVIPEGKKVGDVKRAAKSKRHLVPLADIGSKKVGDSLTFTYPEDGKEYTGTLELQQEEKHPKCKVSDTADSKKVYGVFFSWDSEDDGYNDMYVAAVGTYVIRVHKDVTVESGDLLVSNGDGTAKVQDDDIVRTKTVAKVLTNIKQETYSDGSYTVPCALYTG